MVIVNKLNKNLNKYNFYAKIIFKKYKCKKVKKYMEAIFIQKHYENL